MRAQAGSLFDLVIRHARAGIGQNCHVRLIGDLEFLQHRFSIAGHRSKPTRNKFHLWIAFTILSQPPFFNST